MESAAAIYPGPDAAFFSAFHSPVTVDHRVVRVTNVIMFFMALFAGALAGRTEVEWLVSDCTTKIQQTSCTSCKSAAGQLLQRGWVGTYCKSATGQLLQRGGVGAGCHELVVVP